MADANGVQQHETVLAIRLHNLWEQAHGSPAGKVHVIIGTDCVAAWLDDVLSLTERAVIKRAEDQQLMERYAEQRLAVIRPELQAHVEAVAGRHVVTSNIHADMDTGHCGMLLSPGRAISAAARRRGDPNLRKLLCPRKPPASCGAT